MVKNNDHAREINDLSCAINVSYWLIKDYRTNIILNRYKDYKYVFILLFLYIFLLPTLKMFVSLWSEAINIFYTNVCRCPAITCDAV